MKFIDLFSGLGGFHVALRQLGHNCVFASEIDPQLRELYKRNFGILPEGDVRSIEVSDIPTHDILCAGFPCQPYSKAGEQNGASCPRWGDLFEQHVIRVIKAHKPKYVLLENVPNLGKHNNGHTWNQMQLRLGECGYEVDSAILSPHHFGIPQIRERMFIVGSRVGLDKFIWPSKTTAECLISSILDCRPVDAKPLSDQVTKCLEVWQDFLDRSPTSVELPSFPIWTMEFGATYPFEDATPYGLGTMRLRKYKGAHGFGLSIIRPQERFGHLPSYARTEETTFPSWKIQFIKQNREYYKKNKQWIRPWLPEIFQFPPSLQKFEWNCKGEERNIWKYIIQFRASGVRVKRPTTAPSLVAMTTTQVPIIAWERRYMTPRECSRLQSLNSLRHLPDSPTKAYEALGNAVNADVVRRIGEALLTSGHRGKDKEASSHRKKKPVISVITNL
jgi:DNA (cytosine-5)-methyltransferase 1